MMRQIVLMGLISCANLPTSHLWRTIIPIPTTEEGLSHIGAAYKYFTSLGFTDEVIGAFEMNSTAEE